MPGLIFTQIFCKHNLMLTSIFYFKNKYYSNIDHKLTSINDKLTKKSLKYLAKFQQHEKKLQEKLGKLNADATNLFANSNEEYNQFIAKIKSNTAKASGEIGQYIPYLDTLSTSLSFLKQFKNIDSDLTKPIAAALIISGSLTRELGCVLILTLSLKAHCI